jgi:hypothetical protein
LDHDSRVLRRTRRVHRPAQAQEHLRASAAFGSAQAYWYGERGDGSAWLVTENGTPIRRACNFGNATDEVLLLGRPLPAETALLAA